MKKNTNFITDAEGNRSSKRLAGLSFLALGAIMASVLFIFGILNHQTAHIANEATYCVLITGCTLLGITPLDRIRGK